MLRPMDQEERRDQRLLKAGKGSIRSRHRPARSVWAKVSSQMRVRAGRLYDGAAGHGGTVHGPVAVANYGGDFGVAASLRSR